MTAKIAGIKQTTLWEKQLAENPENFEKSIEEYIKNTVTIKRNIESYEKEGVGICPKCKNKILEGKMNYYCTGYRNTPACDFKIWKNFMSSSIGLNDAKALLSGITTGTKKLKKKDGTSFSAKLKMEGSEIKLIFDKKNYKVSSRN